MRIDVLTIFPAYLAPLDLSLLGKARRERLLDVRVRDLREYTHDRHRTVDDTPYGGGAGMVMRPEPWGEALDALLASASLTHAEESADAVAAPSPGVAGEPSGTRAPGAPVLVVPGPGGEPFTQAMAGELAAQDWLVFACGRYEGIDERVYEYARARLGQERVRVVSLGDYVLNGGEAAVLAMVEAIARLVPGVIGNASSLDEESHTGGLLEYPVYTKPPTWRGLHVPPVLLAGDHGRTAAWRHEQRLARTAARRPDLLPACATLDGSDDLPIRAATPADAAEIFVLQRCCWLGEAQTNDDWTIPPLMETLDDVRVSLAPGSPWRTWVVRDPDRGRLVASVRGRLVADGGLDEDGTPATWEVGRLMVVPDLMGRGLGRSLLAHVLDHADPRARRAWLITGAASVRNQRLYRRAGFRVLPGRPRHSGTVEMGRPLGTP